MLTHIQLFRSVSEAIRKTIDMQSFLKKWLESKLEQYKANSSDLSPTIYTSRKMPKAESKSQYKTSEEI